MISQPNFSEPSERAYPIDALHATAQVAPNEFADDLTMVLQTLWRRRTAFILGFVPVILVAGVYLQLATPQFMASATLVIDPRKQTVTTSPEVLADADPNSAVIDTQVQLIKSREVLGRAVDKLEESGYQKGSSTPGLLQRLVNSVKTVARPPVEAQLELPQRDLRQEAIDQLSSGLDVSRVDLTFAIRINYESEDPEYSARAANAIGAAYREYQLELKQQATKEANQWLSEQVTELRKRVETAESAVDLYRSKSGLLTARGSTSTESQVTNLDLGFNEAQQILTAARAKLDSYTTAMTTAGAAEAAKIVASPTMQSLRSQYSVLANQRAQMSPTLGPSHPQMVELNRQFASLQTEINAEANRTIAELRSDVAVAEKRVDGLLAIRDESRALLAQDNAASVELTQLQANAQSLRSLYEDMLTRLQQTSAQESLNQVNATIVTAAFAPSKPSSPKVGLIVSGAAAVGLAVGAIAVMLAQLIDGTIVNPRELERKTRLPTLALVPELRRRELKVSGSHIPISQYVLGKPLSLFAESFRNLRVSVRHSVGKTDSLVVQITSGTFAEGKTVSSIAFAQAAAMDGRRVLLIDADVRRKSLTKYLGIRAEAGLMELLCGEASLDEVLIAGGERGKPHILPLSRNDAGPHDCFSGQMFGAFLEMAKKGFDLIIIDSAPVLVVAESLVLARRVDAVVVVARWSSTPLTTTMKAVEAINRAGGCIAGTLLTYVNMKKLTNQTYGKKHYPALVKYYQH